MRLRIMLIAAVVGLVWLTGTWPAALMCCAPTSSIERYLLRQTPLGSDEAVVRRWLISSGALVGENGLPRIDPPPRVGINDEMLYPNCTFKWDEVVATFRTPRPFEVRATYTFGRDRRLKDVQVRKTN